MRPMRHRVFTHRQFAMQRGYSPSLMMPQARAMREPGTNYLTYITANGPMTIYPHH